MIAGGGQGLVGEASDPFDKLVEGVRHGVDLLESGRFPTPLLVPLRALEGFEAGQFQGFRAAGDVPGGDAAVPADGAVEVGSIVPVDQGHVLRGWRVRRVGVLHRGACAGFGTTRPRALDGTGLVRDRVPVIKIEGLIGLDREKWGRSGVVEKYFGASGKRSKVRGGIADN